MMFGIPSRWLCVSFVIFNIVLVVTATHPDFKCLMYLTGQHNVVPEPARVTEITHVALAFMRAEIFNDQERTKWPLFTTVKEVRSKFAPNTVVQVAIGGWGDTESFSKAANTEQSRRLFASNVKAMLDSTGADGVDIDWEYPGGNGEDYKAHPNSEKAWEIEAYPRFLAEIRTAIGPGKVISAAVPGLPRDMLAFTSSTIPEIMESVDFLNIMTYDMMNRRDNVTKHHTGVHLSLEAVETYIARGVPPEKANLGLAFYVKWFKTAPDAKCHIDPIGCQTELMEDPDSGGDLGKAGAFSWHDTVPSELAQSFKKAQVYGQYDDVGGGYFFWDEDERLFWSWDTSEAIQKKLPRIVVENGLGGVFAWGLGEDAPEFEHLEAATDFVQNLHTTDSEEVFGDRTEL